MVIAREESFVISESRNIEATLLSGVFGVGLIKSVDIAHHMWALTHALCFAPQPFMAVTRESRGDLTVVLPEHVIAEQFDPSKIELGAQCWRVVSLYLGPAASEEPGVVSYISQLMHTHQISILNLSTFDCDVILIQERDIELAVQTLRTHLVRGVHGLLESIENEQKDIDWTLSKQPRTSLQQPQPVGQLNWLENREHIESQLQPTDQWVTLTSPMSHIAKLELDGEDCYSLAPICRQIMELLFYTPQWSQARFLCAVTDQTHGTSIILDEESIQMMPEELLCICPIKWSIIALCGQPLPFNEVGTVCGMSTPATEEHISILNVSSFAYNYTFVPQEDCKLALSAIGANYRLEPLTDSEFNDQDPN